MKASDILAMAEAAHCSVTTLEEKKTVLEAAKQNNIPVEDDLNIFGTSSDPMDFLKNLAPATPTYDGADLEWEKIKYHTKDITFTMDKQGSFTITGQVGFYSPEEKLLSWFKPSEKMLGIFNTGGKWREVKGTNPSTGNEEDFQIRLMIHKWKPQ